MKSFKRVLFSCLMSDLFILRMILFFISLRGARCRKWFGRKEKGSRPMGRVIAPFLARKSAFSSIPCSPM